MTIEFSSQKTPDSDWDEWIAKNFGNYCQSTFYSEFHQSLNIGDPIYCNIRTNNNLIGRCLIIDQVMGSSLILGYLPRKFNSIIMKILKRIPQFCSYTFHMGPIFDTNLPDDIKNLALSSFWTYLDDLSKKTHHNIGPTSYMGFENKQSAQNIIKQLKKNTNLKVKISGTIRVDISNPDDLYNTIDYSRRKNINRAKKIGVITKISDTSMMSDYWKNLKESWAKYGVSVPSFRYYQSYQNQIAKLFFTYKDQHLISGNAVLIFGQTCIESSVFISEYEKNEKTRGGDLSKWEIVNYCHQQGIKVWDLNMVEVAENDEKTERINFYKMQWGGSIVYGMQVFKLNSIMKLVQNIKHKLIGE